MFLPCNFVSEKSLVGLSVFFLELGFLRSFVKASVFLSCNFVSEQSFVNSVFLSSNLVS